MEKQKIERLAEEIRQFLDDNFINGDCRIFFNGICWEHGAEDRQETWDTERKVFLDAPERREWKVIEGISPKDYFDHADGIISMSFEGGFYDVLNSEEWVSYIENEKEFTELLKKYGCYYELGNAWNLSIYEK